MNKGTNTPTLRVSTMMKRSNLRSADTRKRRIFTKIGKQLQINSTYQ